MSVESSLRELLREELDRARRELTAEVRTEIHQAIAAMRQPEPTAELLSVTAAGLYLLTVAISFLWKV